MLAIFLDFNFTLYFYFFILPICLFLHGFWIHPVSLALLIDPRLIAFVQNICRSVILQEYVARSKKVHYTGMDGSNNQANSRDAALEGKSRVKERRKEILPGRTTGLTRARSKCYTHRARLSFETAVGDVVAAINGEKLRFAK